MSTSSRCRPRIRSCNCEWEQVGQTDGQQAISPLAVHHTNNFGLLPIAAAAAEFWQSIASCVFMMREREEEEEDHLRKKEDRETVRDFHAVIVRETERNQRQSERESKMEERLKERTGRLGEKSHGEESKMQRQKKILSHPAFLLLLPLPPPTSPPTTHTHTHTIPLSWLTSRDETAREEAIELHRSTA